MACFSREGFFSGINIQELTPFPPAMGRLPETAQATVRFSLGKWTTGEEIGQTIAALPAIVARLRL